jgi:sulfur-carrier protein
MPSIRIPTPLRAYTGGNAEVATEGTTVGEALNHLVSQYPDLKTHLYQDEKLRSFVNIFIGDEDIRFLDGEGTPIKDDTKLRIIPSIAGGY